MRASNVESHISHGWHWNCQGESNYTRSLEPIVRRKDRLPKFWGLLESSRLGARLLALGEPDGIPHAHRESG